MAEKARLHFEQLSAIYSGVQDLRRVFEAARDRRKSVRGRRYSLTKSTVSTARSKTAFCR